MSPSTRRSFLVGSLGGISAAAAFGAGAFGQDAKDAKSDPPSRSSIERRKLGKTGLDVSVLGFGAAEIGYARTEQDKAAKILNAALDAGCNAIDTAECYGISEEQIGKALASRRNEYFLFTKVGHFPEKGWTADGIAQSIDRSLERLATDHVDVIHLHSCDKAALEKGEVIEALETAKKAGKTRFIGYSGDSAAARFAVESGRFDTLMTSASIADQEAIELTLPLAREKEMGVIIKRGIANAVWRYDGEPESDYHKEYWRRMQELAFDFCKGERRNDNGPDGAASIALRFTLGLPGVHTTVVGSTIPERFAQNAKLLEAGPLAQARIDAIRKRWSEVAKPEWVGQI